MASSATQENNTTTKSEISNIPDIFGGEAQNVSSSTKNQVKPKKGFGFIKQKEENKETANPLEGIDFTGGDINKQDQTIHINQTSNINITVVQTGQQKQGFSFIKNKNKENKNDLDGLDSLSLESQDKKNDKKQIDITELLNLAYEDTKKDNNIGLPVTLNLTPSNTQENNSNPTNGCNMPPYFTTSPYSNVQQGYYGNGYPYGANPNMPMNYGYVQPPYQGNMYNMNLQNNNNYESMFKGVDTQTTYDHKQPPKDDKFGFINDIMKNKK